LRQVAARELLYQELDGLKALRSRTRTRRRRRKRAWGASRVLLVPEVLSSALFGIGLSRFTVSPAFFKGVMPGLRQAFVALHAVTDVAS
jgi:hypothetical protein